MANDDGLVRLAVLVGPDDHVRGPENAPVTLVEYGDFECPYCRMAFPIVRALEAAYPTQLRVVWRSFPLAQHPHAEAAAETAEFAADFGKLWEMHDLLFLRDALDQRHLLAYVAEVGLDPDELAAALRDQRYRPVIEEVKEGGEESGIPGTPAFYLNGVLFEDEPTQENLSHAVDWLLKHGAVAR
jgi:protein-disulfide isomerase